ncbi:hypothetical protein [Tahibacter amnicola]|uniref:Uncharacterized protein n=1 Tax=Tahibacter amnicola TaxID=2976241 RepID=A0ABY6BHY0_9GAMM|nr:hypothetical protein [Tahibacter amnicola]UXI69377.1 hypothetical protein N4264_06935 [Tahibacter amnicola]
MRAHDNRRRGIVFVPRVAGGEIDALRRRIAEPPEFSRKGVAGGRIAQKCEARMTDSGMRIDTGTVQVGDPLRQPSILRAWRRRGRGIDDARRPSPIVARIHRRPALRARSRNVLWLESPRINRPSNVVRCVRVHRDGGVAHFTAAQSSCGWQE